MRNLAASVDKATKCNQEFIKGATVRPYGRAVFFQIFLVFFVCTKLSNINIGCAKKILFQRLVQPSASKCSQVQTSKTKSNSVQSSERDRSDSSDSSERNDCSFYSNNTDSSDSSDIISSSDISESIAHNDCSFSSDSSDSNDRSDIVASSDSSNDHKINQDHI